MKVSNWFHIWRHENNSEWHSTESEHWTVLGYNATSVCK